LHLGQSRYSLLEVSTFVLKMAKRDEGLCKDVMKTESRQEDICNDLLKADLDQVGGWFLQVNTPQPILDLIDSCDDDVEMMNVAQLEHELDLRPLSLSMGLGYRKLYLAGVFRHVRDDDKTVQDTRHHRTEARQIEDRQHVFIC
jgi:hypothetical protein